MGVAACLGVGAFRFFAGEMVFDALSPRIGGGLGGPVAMPPADTGGIVLAAGLLLYLAGLFAPLAGRDTAPQKLRGGGYTGARR
jgi:hypothetical protein